MFWKGLNGERSLAAKEIENSEFPTVTPMARFDFLCVAVPSALFFSLSIDLSVCVCERERVYKYPNIHIHIFIIPSSQPSIACTV